MFADYHVHSSFSDDSTYPMEKEVQHAIALKMDEICFCEHTDYGMRENQVCDFYAYFQEIKRCQKKYPAITIKAGQEFGMQRHTISQYQDTFDKYPFDFIILSCHQVNGLEFWNQDFQKGKTQAEYNRAYYEEIYAVMQNYTDYSVLGHLDAIKRDDKCGAYPLEPVKDIIEKILRLAIASGKGIEVNTSSFRYHLDDLTPCKEILKLYHDLGGTILTIGSDSHKEEHLAAHFLETIEELLKIGFKSYCTFEQMKPIFYPLRSFYDQLICQDTSN